MGWHDFLVESDDELRRILRNIRTIAVIGIKDESKPNAAAHSVPAYLKSKGYMIYGVNPKVDRVFGDKCFQTIADVPEPVDAVLVFRAPNHMPRHAEEVLHLDSKPYVFWMQSGISHMDAAHKLAKAGIKVVQDHCMYMEHLRLLRTTRVPELVQAFRCVISSWRAALQERYNEIVAGAGGFVEVMNKIEKP